MLKQYIAQNLYQWIRGLRVPPAQISITPTNHCNLRCQSCWKRDELSEADFENKSKEMSDQRLLKVIQEAKELGVKCVELTGGGEPLVRKNIVELIKEIKKADMIGWITSNGTLFSPDTVKLMVELEWDKLTISFDGPDAQTNDFLRPPAGSFVKILETLSLFKEYKNKLKKDKPQITFNVVVSKYNIDKLSEIIELARKSGVEGVTFEPIKVLSEQCKQLLLDFEGQHGIIEEKFRKAQEVASGYKIFTNIEGLLCAPELIKYSGKLIAGMPHSVKNSGGNKLLDVPCFEPWFHVYLEVDGNIRPCCVSPGLGENINHRPLRDVWFGEKFSSFRNAILKRNYPESCNQCNANLMCFSQELRGLLKEKLAKEPIIPTVDLTPPQEVRATKLPKLLVSDTAPLYPPLWGGPIRIWNLFSDLAENFEVIYVGPVFRWGEKYKEVQIRPNLKEIAVPITKLYYPFRWLEFKFLKGITLEFFSYLFMFIDRRFKKTLKNQDADILIASHPWSFPCFQKTRKEQIFVYDSHNCEYLLMKMVMKDRWYKGIVCWLTKIIEKSACRKSDIIFACSEADAETFVRLYGVSRKKIHIIPNGTNIHLPHFSKEERQVIKKELGVQAATFFVGTYYNPNIEAVRFIIDKLAPSLEGMTFFIAGWVERAFCDTKLPKNVRLLGRVDDDQLYRTMAASDIAINPMMSGSGVNIKILEYLSFGLPTVATPTGARGVNAVNREHMLICEPDDFTQCIRELQNDLLLRERLSRKGRELVEQHFDWNILRGEMVEILTNGNYIGHNSKL